MTKIIFVGLAVPSEGSKALDQVLIKMKKQDHRCAVKWVPAENWHITLRYFGDMKEADIDSLAKHMSTVAASTPSFELDIRGLGAFPEVDSARVLWAGVSKTRELVDLQEKLLGLKELGDLVLATDDYEFVPHLTLGRMKNAMSVRSIIEPFARKSFFRFQVRELVLYESVRVNYMSRYMPLARAPLG